MVGLVAELRLLLDDDRRHRSSALFERSYQGCMDSNRLPGLNPRACGCSRGIRAPRCGASFRSFLVGAAQKRPNKSDYMWQAVLARVRA